MFVFNDFADSLKYFFLKEKCSYGTDIEQLFNKKIFIDK